MFSGKVSIPYDDMVPGTMWSSLILTFAHLTMQNIERFCDNFTVKSYTMVLQSGRKPERSGTYPSNKNTQES
jgi:hypothetical protein